MKDVQCYELFGGIALKNHAFSLHLFEEQLSMQRLVETHTIKIKSQHCNPHTEKRPDSWQTDFGKTTRVTVLFDEL